LEIRSPAWDGYASSLIEIDIDGTHVLRLTPAVTRQGRWPFSTSLHVMTAFNPGSRRLSAAANADRDRSLRAEIEGRYAHWRRAVGYSVDRSWVEPGYAMDDALPRMLRLARLFEQAAIFSCSESSIKVIAADGRCVSVRAWIGEELEDTASMLVQAHSLGAR
jgi:uncharacterized protein DUF3293